MVPTAGLNVSFVFVFPPFFFCEERHGGQAETHGFCREKLGVEPEQLQLVFGGRVMGDEKTVGELAIKAGAVIHAVLNLRGGTQ